MCYEFVLDCDPLFIRNVASLSVNQAYFLVCLGELNYVYSSDTAFIAKLAARLAKKNLQLHNMTELEMREVLQAPDTRDFQKLYGSALLYRQFYELHVP
jgi:hypothetical protein